jgi:hypothetical protein
MMNHNRDNKHTRDSRRVIENKCKIYIDKYHPKDIKPHLSKLSSFLKGVKKHYEFVSNNSVLLYEGSQLMSLNYKDGPILKNGNFIVDKSNVVKEKVLSQIPYDHFLNEFVLYYYGKSLNLQLVVEEIIKDGKYFVHDFYFLANESFDFDNKLIAEELEWFLSVLK